MISLAGLFVINALSTASLVVDLPEGRHITVMNDLHEPEVMAHELQVNTFLGSGGEGVIRMSEQVPGMHGLLNRGPLAAWGMDDRNFQVAALSLVGIAASPSPRVYLLPQRGGVFLPSTKKKDAKSTAQKILALEPTGKIKRAGEEIGVRATDWFENAAMEQLKAGNAYVTTKDGELTRGMGAIRASASCLRCHEDSKEGDMLGAFTSYVTFIPSKNTVKRKAITEALQTKAPASDLWKAMGEEPRRVDNSFVRFDAQMQLDLRLAANGFVTDSLVAGMQKQRAELETRHLKQEPNKGLWDWYSLPTQKVLSKAEGE